MPAAATATFQSFASVPWVRAQLDASESRAAKADDRSDEFDEASWQQKQIGFALAAI